MIPCNGNEICRAVSGKLLQDGEVSLTGISTDSRQIAAGDLFIPLVGERFDGHAYVEMSLQAGAAGCLYAGVPEQMLPGKTYIQVEDTLLALKALASWYRGRFDLPVVQITGSAGKTTTKEMIASVLSQRLNTLKTEANYNNAIGTPRTLMGLAPEHQAAVIETGMNHFGEIRYLGEMVRPDAAVITNVGDAHIENLGGTRQGILQAKCEIFENLAAGGVAILNGDDALLNTVTLPQRIIRCGRSETCDVRVTDEVSRGIEGMTCRVTTERDTYALEIPTPGAYMIYPAAMAVAVGEWMGLSKEEIIRGVAAYRPTGSRMHLVHGAENRLIIDDCYNANPQAMAEALRLLAVTDRTRRVAVLGDMGELGDLTESAHRDMGRLTAELKLDGVIAIGPKAAAIAQTAEGNVWHFMTIEEALPTLHEQYQKDTAVLVKASHSMEFHKIVKELEHETK